MRNLSTLLFVFVNITGCASLGSENVDGEDMLRVQETGIGLGARWLPWMDGSGNVGGCRMEQTGALPPGTKFEYNGIKCHVTVEPDGP